jgi:glycosyltransferase involved in cell wall biosynthesis
VGKADVLYVNRRNPFSVIRQLLKTPHDVLYMKSFFSQPFSILPVWMLALGCLRTRRILIAPCGEFSLGALALKRFRKRLYIGFARNLSIYRRAAWHATSVYEAEDIRRELGNRVRTITARSLGSRAESNLRVQSGLRMIIASELPSSSRAVSSESVVRTKVTGELRIVFLSRVVRKKNLAGALNSLFGLSGNVRFDIYGPLEDKRYWDECQRIIAQLPKNVLVRYRDCVPHDSVNRVLASYHLFFFPTTGENFGYVILEALLAGCPVLISNQTSWRGLEAVGVGWDLPLDQRERFRAVLQHCIHMGPEDYDQLSARAREYGLRHSHNPEIIEQNRRLFDTVELSTGP